MGWFSHDCSTDGHRLKGRYDYVFQQDLVSRLISCPTDISQLKEKIYVHDICVRCGVKFNRDDNNNAG